LQWRHQEKERRKRLRAQRELADEPHIAHGVMVSGAKCTSALFAVGAQGKAHIDETREVLYENSRLHMVSEGKPHRERAMNGAFRFAASPDERAIPQGRLSVEHKLPST
jgi:hypothetical protein